MLIHFFIGVYLTVMGKGDNMLIILLTFVWEYVLLYLILLLIILHIPVLVLVLSLLELLIIALMLVLWALGLIIIQGSVSVFAVLQLQNNLLIIILEDVYNTVPKTWILMLITFHFLVCRGVLMPMQQVDGR